MHFPWPQRSLSFYAALFFVIAPFYAIPPFAWAYVIYSLWYWPSTSYSMLKLCLFYWGCFEVIFSAYYRLLIYRVDTKLPDAHTIELDILRNAFKRVLQAGMASLPLNTEKEPFTGQVVSERDQHVAEYESVSRLNKLAMYPIESLQFDDPRAVDYREYMRTWFHKKPWAEIHTHEMRQWLYWAIFNTTLPTRNTIPTTHAIIIEEALALVQRRAGAILKEGSNPHCKPVLLTIDPVTIHPRPLIFYALLWAINRLSRNILVYCCGFQYGKHRHFE